MRAGADEEMGIVAGREVAQNLRDALGGQLTRSAAARGVIDQAFFLAKKQHACSTKSTAETPRTPRKASETKRVNAPKPDSPGQIVLCSYFYLACFVGVLGVSAVCCSCLLRFLFHAGLERLEHPLFIGELFGFQLGIEQLPVDAQLEAASAGGNQGQILNLLLEPCQYFARQTDGLRFVPSHGSVAQLQMHGHLLCLCSSLGAAPIPTTPTLVY
jgi:hypothetical protein